MNRALEAGISNLPTITPAEQSAFYLKHGMAGGAMMHAATIIEIAADPSIPTETQLLMSALSYQQVKTKVNAAAESAGSAPVNAFAEAMSAEKERSDAHEDAAESDVDVESSGGTADTWLLVTAIPSPNFSAGGSSAH